MTEVDTRTAPWTFVLDEPTRILVVDDDPILREFASVYLATPCTTIDTACDGAAARIRLAQNPYDILLLDIEMPHVDGISLLEEIRAADRLKHLPVMMLTGHDDIASVDRAYQAGANSFSTKPVNWRLLSYHIRYVIRASRAEVRKATAPAANGAESADHDVAHAHRGDVREFLRSVLCRAAALEEKMSLDERAACADALAAVRRYAADALQSCGIRPASPTTTSGGTPLSAASDFGSPAETQPKLMRPHDVLA